METIRGAVREQWEREQAAKHDVKPAPAEPKNPQRQTGHPAECGGNGRVPATHHPLCAEMRSHHQESGETAIFLHIHLHIHTITSILRFYINMLSEPVLDSKAKATNQKSVN